MRNQNFLIVAVVLLLTFANFAQDGETLSEKASQAYKAKNYKQSAELYVAALENEDNKSSLAYNAACSFALAGEKEKAFKYLDAAIDFGYTNASHLKEDTDLQSLHQDKRWQNIVFKVEEKSETVREFWDSSAIATPYRENISENEKIAGLAKLWSEVKYNFVNFDLVPDVKWNDLFVEYLPKVRQTKSTFEYYRVLMEMIAKLRDGHSNVYVPKELEESVYARPHMRAALVEDKVIVTEVFSDEILAKGINVGQVILNIDRIPSKKYAEEFVMPYQSSSTIQDLNKRTYNYFLFAGEKGQPVKLNLLDKSGKTFETEVQRYYGEEFKKLSNKKPQEPFEFKILSNNIGYVALNTFADNKVAEEFENNFEAISKTDSLIIDIRQNGGGNSNVGRRILSMLTDKSFATSKWHTREYRPAYRAWGSPEGKFGKNVGESPAHGTKHYKKPIIVLTSPQTFSAAEDFAVAFDVMDRGLIIGEPTGGSTGQPLFLNCRAEVRQE
jgi:carboxyl-terminal processing protease